MGDHHHRLPELTDRVAQERQDLGAGGAVQVAGRLVAEDDVRPGDQRPRAGDPLLLAAGQLGRLVVQPGRQAHGVDDQLHPLLVRPAPGDVEGQRDVLRRGQRRQQVELLEDEADAVAAQLGQLPVRQARELHVADEHPAAADRVEAGQAVHQRRLARTGRPHDRREPAPGEVQVDAAQRGDLGVPGAVDLRQPLRPGGQARPTRTARRVVGGPSAHWAHRSSFRAPWSSMAGADPAGTPAGPGAPPRRQGVGRLARPFG